MEFYILMMLNDAPEEIVWRSWKVLPTRVELRGIFARGSPYSRLVLIRCDSYLLISIRFSSGLSLVRRPPHSSRVLSSPLFLPVFRPLAIPTICPSTFELSARFRTIGFSKREYFRRAWRSIRRRGRHATILSRSRLRRCLLALSTRIVSDASLGAR